MTCPTCGKPQLTEQPHQHGKPKLPTWRLIQIGTLADLLSIDHWHIVKGVEHTGKWYIYQRIS